MLHKNTKMLVIILSVVDFVFIIAFSVLFLFVQKQILNTVEKENLIKNEIKKVESSALMDKELLNNKIYTDKLGGYILGENSAIDFIDTLEKIISNNNLKSEVKSLTYEASSMANFELARIKIDITGEWGNVIFFLELLENYPLKIGIDNVSLKKFSEYKISSRSVPQWIGSFDFTVLKYKEI